jgi:hypothetical protein
MDKPNAPRNSEPLAEKGIDISVTVVDQLLSKHLFCRRQAVKTNACGLAKIEMNSLKILKILKNEYVEQGNPTPQNTDSVKKKELIGNFIQRRKTYTTKPKRSGS